jgi:hypothetical protein
MSSTLVGKKFSNWTVIGLSEKRSGQVILLKTKERSRYEQNKSI